ncbi:MAG: SPOR domain-containing protein [Candidatus Methylomirabilales bacterium]
MKKYNFLEEPSDPSEPTGDSSGRLSPQARRLLIIGVVGIIVAGGLYVYTTYFAATPPPPPPPIALRGRRVQRPKPPTRVTPPRLRRGPAKPPVPATAPQPAPKGTAASPQRGTLGQKAPGVAAPPQVPRARPKPAPPPIVAEKPAPKPPPAPVVAEKPTPKALATVTKPVIQKERRYTLQVASLVVKGNALSLMKRLKKLGYTPVIHKTTAPITRHRVYGGEFTSREEAEQAARSLNVDGFPSNLVKAEGGKFGLEVGSSFRLNEAIDLARSLQKKNYNPKIVSKATPTLLHQVWVGKFENRREALKALEGLKRHGFTPLVVKR